MDLLSSMLESLQLRTAAIGHFDFGVPWCFSMDYAPAHCYFVVKGSCWLQEAGAAAGRWLREGDAVLLVRGGRCLLGSGPGLPALPWTEVWATAARDEPGFDARASLAHPLRLSWGAEEERTHLLALAFGIQDEHLHPLLSALPATLVVESRQHASPWSASALQFMTAEAPAELPGFAAMSRQLAELLFIDLLRRHVLATPQADAGWLRGLSDPAISKAISAMHREPGRDWTVATLAAQAGLSRTVFAERFGACMGQAPKSYLTAWRMHCARDLLAARRPVGEVAAALGYGSERAFREAFKRSAGEGPRSFSTARRAR